jgi:hypothetical protein
MERVLVETDDRGRVAFVGRQIAEHADNFGEVRVYETAQHRIAVDTSLSGDRFLEVHDTFDEFVDDWDRDYSGLVKEAATSPASDVELGHVLQAELLGPPARRCAGGRCHGGQSVKRGRLKLLSIKAARVRRWGRGRGRAGSGGSGGVPVTAMMNLRQSARASSGVGRRRGPALGRGSPTLMTSRTTVANTSSSVASHWWASAVTDGKSSATWARRSREACSRPRRGSGG